MKVMNNQKGGIEKLILELLENNLMEKCPKCKGHKIVDHNWRPFDSPVTKGKLHHSQYHDCKECDYDGMVPTDLGETILDLVKRHS